MYKFRRDQVLDPEFLTKLVERFKKEYVPRFIRDQQYYCLLYTSTSVRSIRSSIFQSGSSRDRRRRFGSRGRWR